MLISATDEDGKSMTFLELVSAATFLFVAGTPHVCSESERLEGIDTTATSLCYIAYCLAKNPQYFNLLAQELFTAGIHEVNDLHSLELEKLPFLNAIIREGMRVFPPVSGPSGRVVPPGGTTINGYHIPEGVTSPI
jgi:cytochrome P450